MDIREEVLRYFRSIKNEFNGTIIDSRIENIDSTVERLQKFLPNVEAGEYPLEILFEMFFTHLRTDVIFESEPVALFKQAGFWSIKRKYARGTWVDIQNFSQSKYTEEQALKEAKKVATIYSKGYTKIDALNIPTGHIVFANFFLNEGEDYAFSLPEELEYKEEFSINNKAGRQNCMDWLAKTHNLGYVQLGNTSADVFKISDDQIFICPTWFYDEDDRDVLPPENWQRLGEISCPIWRIEFIDKKFLDAKKDLDRQRFEEKDKVFAQVAPGKWSVRNYYHDVSDKKLAEKFGFPVWVELNRIKY